MMCSEKEALHRGKELYTYCGNVSKPIASKPELLDLLSVR